MGLGEERATTTNKHRKKKSHPTSSGSSSLSNGGGGGKGIAGPLVFGGALAVAGFIAISSFATNKNKAKAKGAHEHDPLTKPKRKPPQHLLLDDGCKSQDDRDRQIEGLRCLLQHSTTPTNHVDAASSACTIISQINSSELLPTQTLIPVREEKIDLNLKNHSEVESPTCFHHREIVFSDDSHPERAASSNKNGIEEEYLASLFRSSGFQAQDVAHGEPQESLNSIEAGTEDDDDDVGLESGEEEGSSKATEGTSLNSNEEPVWPAEVTTEEAEGEGGIIDTQSEAQGAAKANSSASADYCVCSNTDDADDCDYAGTNGAVTLTPEAPSNEKANFSLVLNDQPSASHSFQLRTRLVPMLLVALLLLLVLLTYR